MLELDEVGRIAGAAASTAFDQRRVRILSERASDSEGRDALHLTVVVANDDDAPVEGDVALDTMVRIRSALRAAGEERFPIVDFATEQEVSQDVDPEP